MLNELSDPAQHSDVKIEMRRMHRNLGCSSKQAFGITGPVIEKMFCVAGDNLRELRDQTLICLAYESICRQ